MIYFDNNATSPIDEEVREAMLPYLAEEYGNPSSKYYCLASTAKNAIEEAREKVAKLIGASAEEIVFTSGSSESTNFIIKGYMDYRKYYGDGKNHIITSQVEHKATLNVCKFLNGELYSNDDPTISLFGGKKTVNRGYEVSYIGCDSFGMVDDNDVAKHIKDNTALVSLILVNNETGTINDIEKVSSICRNKNIAIHSDITQAVGKLSVDVKKLGVNYASFSAHKIYGPKGIGAAFLQADAYGIEPITAFIHGGEQESGLRAGTHAVHDIVGFGKAAEIALRDLKSNEQAMKCLDDALVKMIHELPQVRCIVPTDKRVPGVISLAVEKNDFHNERFIKSISDKVALSTGSACSAGKPSYVLEAMGLSGLKTKILRISLNKYTTIQDIELLIQIITEELKR